MFASVSAKKSRRICILCKKVTHIALWTIVAISANDDVIKWKHFPCYWPFVRGIRGSLVNSAHKGQWRRALMFSLICAWTNDWVNNRDADDLRRHRANYDVTLMNGWTNGSDIYRKCTMFSSAHLPEICDIMQSCHARCALIFGWIYIFCWVQTTPRRVSCAYLWMRTTNSEKWL